MCISTPLRATKPQSARHLSATSSKIPLQESPRDEILPSRDEAVQMILSSRWWDPSLGAPLPLASLLSHNCGQKRGWLKNLLFPVSAIGADEDVSDFNEKLTLAYLFIISEIEGLANRLAEAWDETEESAKLYAKSTVAKFAYHPILENFPHEYHESIEPITYLFSLFPSGCLGSIDKVNGKLALIFLDAALFRRGRCHSNSVKRLFIACDGATIGKIRNNIVGTLFQQCGDWEKLSSKPPTPSKQSVIQASRQAVANRIPLTVVRQQSARTKALRKRQYSTLHSQQRKKMKSTFWEQPTTGSKENEAPMILRC